MAGDIENATRPIIGIENRTPHEVFDIMSDRIKALYPAAKAEAREAAAKKLDATAKEYIAIGEELQLRSRIEASAKAYRDAGTIEMAAASIRSMDV